MTSLRVLGLALAISLLLSMGGNGTSLASQSHINNLDSDGLALQGFDPVAYFTLGQPTKGLSRFEHVWRGARYRFANAAHRSAFRDDPERYAPSYGGYCAFGFRYGQKSAVDPTQWEIVDGRLHLLLNRATKVVWQRKVHENITVADRLWKELLASRAD